MKLDQDLVREILLAIEADTGPPRGWINLDLEGRAPEEVSYHVMLLHEAGFVEGHDLSTMGQFEWQPERLTYQGHQFLDTVRDSETWRLTKAGAAKVGGTGLTMLWDYAKAVAAERLGL